jgi:hypothetical protein
VGYLWWKGFNRQRWIQIAAIAQGIDLEALREAAQAGQDTINPTQVSLADMARARALLSRDLELREQALANQLANLRTERTILQDNFDRYTKVAISFEEKLKSLREGALATNQETVRLILENIKPKQAKEQIMLMVKSDQMDEAVTLLAAMPTSKRAKVVAEFKTAEEGETLADMLNRIREGVPEITLIDQTQEQLQQFPQPGS